MITAIVNWRVAPGVDRPTLLERFKKSIPVYKNLPGLVRKYICFDIERSQGFGIYLWETREQAEAFYKMATPIIKQETGFEPTVNLYDTPIVVDNLTGETLVYD